QDFVLRDSLSITGSRFSAVYAPLSALLSADDTCASFAESSCIHFPHNTNTREHFCWRGLIPRVEITHATEYTAAREQQAHIFDFALFIAATSQPRSSL